jgi:hypothetical protein
MNQPNKHVLLIYELVGIVFIIFLGSALHFTFEWSDGQPVVGIFSAVNESVWEHLKLAFWPTLFYAVIGYWFLHKQAANLFSAKTLGVCLMITIIPIVFYVYTTVTGRTIFAVDISTFIVAVIIGQLASYKLLTYKRLPPNLNLTAVAALIALALAFSMFTFYPPNLSIFKDAVMGGYGITTPR